MTQFSVSGGPSCEAPWPAGGRLLGLAQRADSQFGLAEIYRKMLISHRSDEWIDIQPSQVLPSYCCDVCHGKLARIGRKMLIRITKSAISEACLGG